VPPNNSLPAPRPAVPGQVGRTSSRCPHRTPFGPRAPAARLGETACGAAQVSVGQGSLSGELGLRVCLPCPQA
jgi:hypothetical protein